MRLRSSFDKPIAVCMTWKRNKSRTLSWYPWNPRAPRKNQEVGNFFPHTLLFLIWSLQRLTDLPLCHPHSVFVSEVRLLSAEFWIFLRYDHGTRFFEHFERPGFRGAEPEPAGTRASSVKGSIAPYGAISAKALLSEENGGRKKSVYFCREKDAILTVTPAGTSGRWSVNCRCLPSPVAFQHLFIVRYVHHCVRIRGLQEQSFLIG